jgi:MYXO-CTERM domain-containing protein
MKHLRFPEIVIPFPSEASPVTISLEQHATDWVQRLQLIQSERTLKRFQAGQFWLLVSYCFPHGAPEALQVVVEWDCWAFMLDDQSDAGQLRTQPVALRALLDKLLLVLDDVPLQNGPLSASLRDVWEHMQRWATPAWRERFRQSVAETFDSLVWEANNRVQGIIPNPSEYIFHRHASSGFATHMDLTDFTEGIAIPPEIRDQLAIRQLTEIANNVISWTNDLFSLEKELQQGDFHNLALVLQHDMHGTLQAAVDQVGVMIAQQVARFQEIERQVPRFSAEIDAALRRYIGVLHSWMRGNLDWSRATGRYDSATIQAEATQPPYIEPLLEERNTAPAQDFPAEQEEHGDDSATAAVQASPSAQGTYFPWMLIALLAALALGIVWLRRRRRNTS